ncbi:MAG TPA: hypothetical protein VML50_08245 [Anaeromyxobacter sp.]|nr:hypothetical protein [Anaeromyxobacter sp.]
MACRCSSSAAVRGRRAGPAALLALGLACARAAPVPAPHPAPAPAPRLPRSSIAAVLEHRAELALDEAQVARLEEAERGLEKELAAVPGSRPAAPVGAPAGEAARPPGRGHGGGGGEGQGKHGGRGQGSPGGQDPDQRRDDADTRAFLQVEEVFRPEQRERAREIAEAYREARYDAREAARAKGGGG